MVVLEIKKKQNSEKLKPLFVRKSSERLKSLLLIEKNEQIIIVKKSSVIRGREIKNKNRKEWKIKEIKNKKIVKRNKSSGSTRNKEKTK